MVKYFCLNENTIYKNGLNDMKDRFTEFLKLSKIMYLIPILPKIYLSDHHTNKKNNLLTDYIEIPDFVLKELPPNTNSTEVFYWNLTNSFIPCDELYIKYRNQIQKYILNINYLNKYKKIAMEIVDQLKKPICCVHVRRSDYLDIFGSLKFTTTPNHISNILEKYDFNDCYIKTSEKNLTFFDELKKKYNIKLVSDFSILKEIYDSGDNYALYSIECCIRDLCDIRISTFNTKKSEECWLPNNDPNYFIDYLDENSGYQ